MNGRSYKIDAMWSEGCSFLGYEGHPGCTWVGIRISNQVLPFPSVFLALHCNELLRERMLMIEAQTIFVLLVVVYQIGLDNLIYLPLNLHKFGSWILTLSFNYFHLCQLPYLLRWQIQRWVELPDLYHIHLCSGSFFQVCPRK